MGYGFFNVRFIKADGTPDPETAKKAFDWAGENLDWVKELKPFALNGVGNWGNNDAEWTDGVDIERTGVPDKIGGWVKQVGDAVGAEIIAASETQDFQESDMDNIGTVAAVYKNGKVEESGYIRGETAYEKADSWIEKRIPIPKNGLEIDKQKKIKGVFDKSALSVIIPAYVQGICNGAFDGCTALKEVHFGGTQAQWFMLNAFGKLPETATVHCSDGDAADPRTATEYAIPEGVTEIGWGVFTGCTSLASVSIPASVTRIARAFEGCTALAEVRYGGTQAQWFMLSAFGELPETVTVHCSDGDAKNPKTATEYAIPEGVTKIGWGAFNGCTSLVSVSIPEGVTEIGSGAFTGCTSLASVSIPASVTEIGSSAFNGCTSLASVTIPEGVTEIGSWAFEGCTSLASVTIPEGVTKIGEGAFKGCTLLASVSIPEGVTEIGGQAFQCCSALKEIRFCGTKEQWEAVKKGDDCICNILAEAIVCTDGNVEIPKFDIEEGVLKKYSGAAVDVTIPNGVTKIGNSAFRDCKSLASVTIPEGVTEIGGYAFEGCTSLTSVIIPEGVTEIGRDAFVRCTSLASVTIPEGVTKIGNEAFEDCTSLASVTIPEGVTEIAYGAFQLCKSLAEVTIPESVTIIGACRDWSAFGWCKALTEIHYTGTKAQWKAVEKQRGWKRGSAITSIICSDGKVKA